MKWRGLVVVRVPFVVAALGVVLKYVILVPLAIVVAVARSCDGSTSPGRVERPTPEQRAEERACQDLRTELISAWMRRPTDAERQAVKEWGRRTYYAAVERGDCSVQLTRAKQGLCSVPEEAGCPWNSSLGFANRRPQGERQ
jgi:hypothetical protein